MKLKRFAALALALCLVLSLAACTGGEATGDQTTTTVDQAVEGDATTTVGGNEITTTVDGNEITTTTVATDGDGNEITTTTATDAEGKPVATTTVTNDKGDKVTTTTVKDVAATTTRTKKTVIGIATKTKGDNTPSTMGAITVKEGKTPLEKGVTFGGKTFSFAYYGASWDEKHENWHNEFQKLYNVKLDIRALPAKEYVGALSSALASGKPYDIVFMYNFDYPTQITANVMTPLNDYVTTADLWTKDSAKAGGFSKALMQGMSLNGNIYCVAGAYLQGPTAVWYNKKLFADAGFTGSQDPVALYKAGKWSWDVLYDMLSEIQDPAKGLWGINSLAPYYSHQMINSFDTDYAKLKNDGSVAQNLDDPNLYSALQMLQKFSFGEQKVADPNNPFEPGIEQFLNGTIACVTSIAGKYGTFYDRMSTKNYSAFGSKAQQVGNLGAVPLPGKNGVVPIWDWMGYGAGNGATEEGILCALTYAKYDSTVNHAQVYDVRMPAEMKKMFCDVMDSDKLRAPLSGFETTAGSLGNIGVQITSAVALKGQNITATLKGYKNLTQTVIDTALKG